MAASLMIPQQPWYYHIFPALAFAYLLLAHCIVQLAHVFFMQRKRLLWDSLAMSLVLSVILYLPMHNYHYLLKNSLIFKDTKGLLLR